jgi:hypothetical protein
MAGPREIFAQLGAGVIVGELALLAICAVLGLGPWPRYVQWFLALSVEMWLLLVLGAGFATVEESPFGVTVGSVTLHAFSGARNEFLQLILVIFAVLVASQAPLWFTRLLRGWRLVRRGTGSPRTAIESRQLQIRDILITMTILAVFLGAMSHAAKTSGGRDDTEFPITVLKVCGFAAVWSTLVLPICVWACFAASSLVVRILVLIGYVTTLAIIALGVVATYAINGVSINLRLILVSHTALLATLFPGLWLARACGYVLVSVRTTRRHGPASR